MKVLKKFVAAVAMAAICCTMTAPVASNAALVTCPPHNYIKKLVDTSIKSETVHTHTEETDIDQDGVPEVIKSWECKITTYVYTYEYECMCGEKLYDTEVVEEKVHTPLE